MIQRKSLMASHALAAICGTVGIVATQAALAEDYQFNVNRATSAATLNSQVSSPLTGTLIGNYDVVNNPTGTITRPGASGGSGNVAIPYSGNVTGGGNSQSNPAGSFSLYVNVSDELAAMADLNIDLLNGTHPSFPATFNVLYSTFHTVQPNSIFFGGIPIPVPLGNLVLDTLAVTQSAASGASSLIPSGRNQYNYSVSVPVNIAYTGSFGGSAVGDTYPAVLIVTGTLVISGNTATASSAINWSVNQTDNGPFTPFVDLPLDVPTIFPTGQTAHLLMSGTIQSITTSLGLNATINANGVLIVPPVPADINGDGHVNVIDLLAVINSWGACPAPPAACPADIAPPPSGDGMVNVADLLMVINNWG